MTTVVRNGIGADLEKWQETQRRAAVNFAERRRAAVVVSREGRKVTARRTPRGGSWTEQTRALARLRSGGVCELCQCATAEHLHHRQPRRGRDHRIVNALHVCLHCHDAIHAGPKRAAKCGLIVHSRANAADVPVVLIGRRVFLTDGGGYLDVETGGAA